MKIAKSFFVKVMFGIFSSMVCISCYDDPPLRELNIGLNSDMPNHFYEGTWDMVEVRIYCSMPNVVNLKTNKKGHCVRDYCHTGSTLEIKHIEIPGIFEYTVDPPGPMVDSGGEDYFENYDEFYSEWGFANGNLATFYPIGKEIGTSCWLILEWQKQ